MATPSAEYEPVSSREVITVLYRFSGASISIYVFEEKERQAAVLTA